MTRTVRARVRPFAWFKASLVERSNAGRCAALLALGALFGSSCAVHKLAYSPTELRANILERIRDIAPERIAVPYEVPAEAVAKAWNLAGAATSRAKRAQALKVALFDDNAFGLRYTEVVTATAAETLASHRGNCLSLAAVYIGLARGIGLKAYFLDASNRVHETREDADMVVKSGHVTAVVETEFGEQALDFGDLGQYTRYRVMDDVEATAHFYNNRGYELIHEAQWRGKPVEWKQVAESFGAATRVMPDFARGWNNLGVAFHRLGREEDAEACYRFALGLDPALGSPVTNLGVLFLARGNFGQALAMFETAAAAEPDSPHVLYHLGLAQHQSGDNVRAVQSLERAVRASPGGYPKASDLLQEIAKPRAGVSPQPKL